MHDVAICQVNQTDANCGCNQALRFQPGSRPKLMRAMENVSLQASMQQSATLMMHKAHMYAQLCICPSSSHYFCLAHSCMLASPDTTTLAAASEEIVGTLGEPSTLPPLKR